jgi:hypothetical protein
MFALALDGVTGITRQIERRGEEIVRQYQNYAADEAVFDELFTCLRRNLNAKKSMRVASGEREAGYSYEVVEDGLTQIAAARTLAQILRLMPAASGVTVNNTANTLNVTTAQDRLAELDSIGVPRAEIAAACQDLLAATAGGHADGADAGR